MHSKVKGNIGEVSVAKDLMKKDFFVFTEMGDLSRIDLIAEKNNKLYRFQVKAKKEVNNCIIAETHKSAKGYKFDYTLNDVDIFAIYCLDTEQIAYIANIEFLANGKRSWTLRLRPAKNNQKINGHPIEVYTLERALQMLA